MTENQKPDFANLKTFDDFLNFTDGFWELDTERDLVIYLRALLGLIRESAMANPTFPLIGRLLIEALTADPVRFEDEWLSYEFANDEKSSPFERISYTIERQIADLVRLEDRIRNSSPAELYGGFDSWYNFSIQDFMRHGAAGIRDHLKKSSNVWWSETPRFLTSDECDWDDLNAFMELGQLYE